MEPSPGLMVSTLYCTAGLLQSTDPTKNTFVDEGKILNESLDNIHGLYQSTGLHMMVPLAAGCGGGALLTAHSAGSY